MATVDAWALDDGAGGRPGPIGVGPLEGWLEEHRAELTALCRRIVGWCDAEDAVQETLVRAWRGLDRYEGRATLGSWLYRIASNVCIDGLRARQRGIRRIEMTAEDLTRGAALSRRMLTAGASTETGAVDAALGNPAEMAVAREAVGLAFATLMDLPPRQRAALILRDVLGLKAVEAAELLEMTLASVNAALRRARSTLAARNPASTRPHPLGDATQRKVLARYIDAFTRYDVEGLCSIARADARRAHGAGRASQRPVSGRLNRTQEPKENDHEDRTRRRVRR